MDSAAAEFALLKFSTDELPERDRISILREVFGRKIAKIEIEPAPDHPLQLDMLMRHLPGLRLHVSTTSPAQLKRTREFIAQGDDDFAFLMVLNGSCSARQGRKSIRLEPGEATLVSHGEPAVMMHSDSRIAGFIFPRSALSPFVADLDSAAIGHFPASSGAVRLLKNYLKILPEDAAFATAELCHATVTHLYDLVALAIGATPEAAEIARGRGVRAARLRAVKSDIIDHLNSADLTEAAVAKRQLITPRYLRMLFETEGLSFSAYVLGERLRRAYRMLSNPRRAKQSISAIAYAVGFGDLSYFNRTFRQRFGATPSEIRAEALRSCSSSSLRRHEIASNQPSR